MNRRLPPDVARILERGSFCHVAAETSRGPHVTPLVFALHGGRLWLTTSRGSVKARAWKADPRVAGLVRAGDLSVSFTGDVRTYDALDPGTWGRSLAGAPTLTGAAARFTRKNARFFAGYAVDAKRVPLAWTPPGRVFVEIRPDRAAVLDGAGVAETWGAWERGLDSHPTFRATRAKDDPLAGLPEDVSGSVGRDGAGALAIQGPWGSVVLPVGWVVDAAGLFGALPAAFLELAGAEADARVALTVDHASWWRARNMVGAMAQGAGGFFVLDRLGSGARSAETRVVLAGVDPEGAALVRIEPRRLVWWRGWSSGTVAPS